jgi:carbohydrate-selective porin OprB
VLRAGRFLQPRDPNQLSLDPRIFQHYGDQIEIEHDHEISGRPGALRVLAFRNRAKMSRYQDALNAAAGTGSVPDINTVRTGENIKYGFGINVEQALSRDVGAFARLSWADGKTETYAYTEIDQSEAAGVLIQAAAWGRGADTVGFAVARNELSRSHRDYLAAGGLGFFLGDGRLNYRPEVVLESFYNLSLAKALALTFDWQHIDNPGYNADRGPVNVGSVRLHLEF